MDLLSSSGGNENKVSNDDEIVNELNKMKALIIAQQKIIEHISEDSKKYLEQIIETIGQINGIIGVEIGIKINSLNQLLFNDKNEYYDDIIQNSNPYNQILVGDFPLCTNGEKYLGMKTIDTLNFNKLIKFAKNLINENRLDEIQIHFAIYE